MLQPIQIVRYSDGQLVEAVLTELAQRHLEDFNRRWRIQLVELGAEDKFWDWAYKKRIAQTGSGYESYAIEWNEITQGLLALETHYHRSQIDSDRGQPLVYVQALATAPWNRRTAQSGRQFSGIGALLLNFARRRSLQLGYGGRVALHALPNAERFYEALNMMNFDPDPDYDGLVYFEYGLYRQGR
ncbi:MAG: GNAT family N-acetyltransferase [Cyanobacteria bacterium J06635_15]